MHAGELPFLGLNKSLSLFLDSSFSPDRVPPSSSHPRLQKWAHMALSYCGRLGLLEQTVAYCRAGLGSLQKAPDGSFDFLYANTPIGVEQMESRNFAGFRL